MRSLSIAVIALIGLAAPTASAFAQWRPYPTYPYGRGRGDFMSGSLRLDVSPRDTEVFVNGYAAGVVDDYDGVFQRLRLRPGENQIVLFLAGHRTMTYDLYLNPGADQRIRHRMEPLGPGETAEAPPPPRPSAPQPGQRRGEPPPRREPPDRGAFGTLSLRLEPVDAEVLVDGERRPVPPGQDVFAIRLTEGRHKIEVRKDGYTTYTEEILIRRDRTLALTVTLRRRTPDTARLTPPGA